MRDHSGPTPTDATGARGSEDLVERLVRLAERGPEPPADGMRRVKASLRPAWEAGVRARRRRRLVLTIGSLAAAALVLVAVALAPRLRLAEPASEPTAANLQVVNGSVTITPPTGPEAAVGAGDAVPVGSWLRTGPDGRAALRLTGGESLRLDHGTRARLGSATTIRLARGAVYVDSGPDGGSGVVVGTALGSVREIGTQFEVRDTERGITVRVRHGAVQLTRGEEQLQVDSGTALTMHRDGTHERSRLLPSDPLWSWVQQVAPPFKVDGRTVVAFLDWVSSETGLWIHFADAETERMAGNTVLHGTIAGLTPAEAPEVVLPGCGLVATPRHGTLVITRLDAERGLP